MFPEGFAYIGVCTRCDEVIIKAYVAGMKLKIDRISVPYRDAVVLAKYWDIILNIWPDTATALKLTGKPGRPITFIATLWMVDTPPTKGRLYIRHLCRLKRKAKRRDDRSDGDSS